MRELLKIAKDKIKHLFWILKGSPIPIDSVYKRKRIIKLAQEYDCDTFIETGTYTGRTILAVKKYFKKVLSIELSEKLYEANIQKFKMYDNIQLFQGDSALKMDEAITHITGRCLFWLDGHYSGGYTAKGESNCPVLGELQAIKKEALKDSVILIDDAREFNGENDYPTLDEIIKILKEINPEYKITVNMDCIIALP